MCQYTSGHSKKNAGDGHDGDRKAVHDLVNEVNERGGVTPDEKKTLLDWSNEYDAGVKPGDIKDQLRLECKSGTASGIKVDSYDNMRNDPNVTG